MGGRLAKYRESKRHGIPFFTVAGEIIEAYLSHVPPDQFRGGQHVEEVGVVTIFRYGFGHGK